MGVRRRHCGRLAPLDPAALPYEGRAAPHRDTATPDGRRIRCSGAPDGPDEGEEPSARHLIRLRQTFLRDPSCVAEDARAVEGPDHQDIDGLERPAPFVCFGSAWTAPAPGC